MSIVLFIVVLGCVEVFSKTTVSILVLLLCFSNIPLRNTVYYAAAETLREIGQGLAARISVYSLEKQAGTSQDKVTTPIASLWNSCFVGRVQFQRLTAFRSEEATDLVFVE